jgi:soluble lytic murein transglycosylase-like protein
VALATVAGLAAGAVANANSEQVTVAPRTSSPATAARNPCPVPSRYRAAFVAAARDTDLPLALLVSVGQVESNLDHRARSSAGATGLLQVMARTAAELQLDATRPETNVLAGARYLKLMMSRFESADLALAAYNAGPTAVERSGGAPSAETLTYVANVNHLWQRLQGCS